MAGRHPGLTISIMLGAMVALLPLNGVQARDAAAASSASNPVPDQPETTGAILAKAAMAASKAATKPSVDLRRMIGQMIIIGFPGGNPADEWPSHVARMIADGQIGGVLLLGGNVQSPKQLKRLTSALIKAGGPVRPFIAVDQEGGAVQRLTREKGFFGLPTAGAVGQTDPIYAYGIYAREARELAANGISVNFGPVVDLNVNKNNPIIGKLDRSYGPTAEAVTPFARAFIRAHKEAGVLTAIKHFPGHGSSTSDPHNDDTADISSTWSKSELEPFKSFTSGEDRAPMVMVGHLILKGYSDGNAPASLSRHAVTDILRKKLAYGGLIVTDDLDMAAVRDHYSVADAFVKAVAAGNDLVIDANNRAPDPHIVDTITDAIETAVQSGKIKRSQIEQSYKRILAAKGQLAEGQLTVR